MVDDGDVQQDVGRQGAEGDQRGQQAGLLDTQDADPDGQHGDEEHGVPRHLAIADPGENRRQLPSRAMLNTSRDDVALEAIALANRAMRALVSRTTVPNHDAIE